MRSCCIFITLVLCANYGDAFTCKPSCSSSPSFNKQTTSLNAKNYGVVEEFNNNNNNNEMSRRKSFMAFTSSAALTLFPFVQNAIADDESSPSSSSEEAPPAPKQISRTIEGCPKPITGKPNNCVATSNIKQLENYSPPWTFEVSPEEAYARLKGILKNESTFTIVETDEEMKYIRAEVPRINNVDSLEFLIKGDDKVVVFKSNEIVGYGLSDYGANKKRVDELRLKSNGVFRLMGGGLTADSIDGGKFGKRNGIAGQLKAFYGLQSGEGFESVFEE